MLRSERRFPLRPRVPHFSASASHMKRLVGSLTASWRNLASNLRHCTRSFIVTSGEMHFPRHFRPVLTTKSLRFGALCLACVIDGNPVQFARLGISLDAGQPFLKSPGFNPRALTAASVRPPLASILLFGRIIAPNAMVEAWGRLPEAAVKALGLKPPEA